MDKLKTKFLLISVLALFLSMILPLAPHLASKTQAASTAFTTSNVKDTFEWYNNTTIKDVNTGFLFVDGNTSDGTHFYNYSNSNGTDCSAQGVQYNGSDISASTEGSAFLDFRSWNDSGFGVGNAPTYADLIIVHSKTNGSSSSLTCYWANTDSSGKSWGQIKIGEPQNWYADYKYNDTYSVSSNYPSPGSTKLLFAAPDSNLFTNSNTKDTLKDGQIAYQFIDNDSCVSYIAVDPNHPEKGTYYSWGSKDGSCKFWGKNTVTFAQIDKFNKKEANNPDTTKIPTQTNDEDQNKDNEGCASLDNPLSWVVCPLVYAADQLEYWARGWFKDVLEIMPAEYGDKTEDSDKEANPTNDLKTAWSAIRIAEYGDKTEDSDKEANPTNDLKTAWSAIRILATVVLVGIALFMVIAQIFNFDFVSAYTIKKVVPKLIAAIILMQLSWFLATTLIQVINIIGNAIQSLLWAPFGGSRDIGEILGRLFGSGFSGKNQILTSTIIVAGATGGIGAVGGIAGIVMGIVLIVLGLAIALVTLVIRKAIIIFLLVISPLAIVFWILPGTSKWWDMWKDNFFKLLLMFPIIIGFISIGQIFAYITAESGTQDTIAFFIILVAYFGPMFLIPKTFGMGGQLMSMTAKGVSTAGWKLKGIRPIRRIEEAKKRNIEAREYNAKRKGESLMTNGKNGFTRGIGRVWAGKAGANVYGLGNLYRSARTGKLDKSGGAYAAQLRGSEEKQAMDNAQFEYSAATGSLSHPLTMDANEEICKAKIGERITLSNGRSVIVSAEMQRISLTDALQRKQEKVIDTYASSQDAAKIDNFEKLKKEQFGLIDKSMNDVTRGGGVSAMEYYAKDNENFSLAFSSIEKTKYTSQKDIANGKQKTRANLMIDHMAILRTYGGNDDKSMMATLVTQLGGREDAVKDLSPEMIDMMDRALPGAKTVILGKGHVKMIYDPATGNFSIKDTSTP